MSTVNHLSAAAADAFDYVVVGGGTAGCLVASRLAEYLPKKRVLLIEGGPSDLNDLKVAEIRKWIDLLGTEYDYDYPITEQFRGPSPPSPTAPCLISLSHAYSLVQAIPPSTTLEPRSSAAARATTAASPCTPSSTTASCTSRWAPRASRGPR